MSYYTLKCHKEYELFFCLFVCHYRCLFAGVTIEKHLDIVRLHADFKDLQQEHLWTTGVQLLLYVMMGVVEKGYCCHVEAFG